MTKRLWWLAALVVLASACVTPGTDHRGRDLIADGNKMVAALEKHRATTGSYPASLSDLPDKFKLKGGRSAYEFFYKAAGDTFDLYFNYRPPWPTPGRCVCSFQMSTKSWKCMGYL